MQLMDYRRKYEMVHAKEWAFTLEVEDEARQVLKFLEVYTNSQPPEDVQRLAKKFIVHVEQWKAMCIREQTGLAARNSDASVWNALQEAVRAKSADIEALRSIMSLVGFGPRRDPVSGFRRAKRATAVLRFLWPKEWGVVDWRNIAILHFLEETSFDADMALARARREDRKALKNAAEIVNEDWACKTNDHYRQLVTPEFPRAADADLALFSLSLEAWPMK